MTTAERETQRNTALLKANDIRTHIKELKAEFKHMTRSEGIRHAAVLIENPSDVVMSMRVGPLLDSIKYVGPTWVMKLLARREIGTSYDRRVRELSPRQRTAIANRLRYHA